MEWMEGREDVAWRVCVGGIGSGKGVVRVLSATESAHGGM
jgi:RecG-like helicase